MNYFALVATFRKIVHALIDRLRLEILWRFLLYFRNLPFRFRSIVKKAFVVLPEPLCRADNVKGSCDLVINLIASVSCCVFQLKTRILQTKDHYNSVHKQSEIAYPSKTMNESPLKKSSCGDLAMEDIQNIALNLQQRKHDFENDAEKRVCGLCCTVFDVILGFLVFLMINQFTSSNAIASFVSSWRDETRDFLSELLEWLMGAPAGLKLNHEMTLFLGHFFQYHIYIWIGYLSLIEPYLSSIIQVISLSSCLGLSFMLSLTVDALNVLTFHTFCFYVYASKIYNLQLNALISLSRLFRGVKWNPLRNRIDSVSYNADQLAVGTILFTVLLFLLPTTGIYYFVFASLRIPILALQAFLCTLVKALNTLPVHSIKKIILYPDQYIDHITFKVHSPKHGTQEPKTQAEGRSAPVIDIGGNWTLSLKYHRMSSLILLKRHALLCFPSLLSLQGLVKSFLTGNIIHS